MNKEAASSYQRSSSPRFVLSAIDFSYLCKLIVYDASRTFFLVSSSIHLFLVFVSYCVCKNLCFAYKRNETLFTFYIVTTDNAS